MMENFYYACIYDILQEPIQPREKVAALGQMQAKILMLHTQRIKALTLDARDRTTYPGETPSLFHLVQGKKRRAARMISEILDENGQQQKTMRRI